MAYACDEIVRLKARPSIAYHGLPPHAAPASAAREHAERAPLFRPTQQHLACLASNAAVKLRLKGFLGTSDEDFEWALRMNFFAALRATRAAITEMVKRGGGAGGTVDYGAAKAALVNVTKALSQEFGPSGIRINDVSPGPVATDLWLGKDGVAETRLALASRAVAAGLAVRHQSSGRRAGGRAWREASGPHDTESAPDRRRPAVPPRRTCERTAPRRPWTSWRAMRRSWEHRRRTPGRSSGKRSPSRFPSVPFSGSGRFSGSAPRQSRGWAWPSSPTS
jgi:hypothetical protein